MEDLICPACKTKIYIQDEFCDICAFPIHGTEKEKAIHIGRFINKKGVVEDSSNALSNVQKILFAISGLYLISFLIIYSKPDSHWLDLLIYGILVGVFLLSAIVLKKSPLFFTVFPLIVLLFFYTLLGLIDSSTIYKGIALKIFIISSLLYSIFLTIKANKFKKKYNVK